MISLSFRGTTIQVKATLLSKLPKHSQFQQYLHEEYGYKGLESIPECCVIDPIYVNQSPYLFNHILDYLQNNHLHFPHCICVSVIKQEMGYWGLEEAALSDCCLDRVLKDEADSLIEQEIKLKWRAVEQRQEIISGYIHDEDNECHDEREGKTLAAGLSGIVPVYNATSRQSSRTEKLHAILTRPGSSLQAKIWAVFMLIVVVMSVFSLSIETESFARDRSFEEVKAESNMTKGSGLYKYYILNTMPERWIFYTDVIFTFILTVDFIARLVLSPNKCLFLKQFLSIVDILGLLPVWILFLLAISYELSHSSFSRFALQFVYYIALLRILRILRFGHILLNIKSLRIVILSLRTSWKELLILFTLVSMCSFLFGIIMFYVELWQADTFLSVFEAQWWAVITMTTVGYGDFYPQTKNGYIVGIACSLSGIVVIAMATTVLVNNFFKTYQNVEKIERLEKYSDKCVEVNQSAK